MKARSQKDWAVKYKNTNMVNGAFFLKNNRPIPPYISSVGNVYLKNKKYWWAVGKTNSGEYVLLSPEQVPFYINDFMVSVCPPLIYNGEDISTAVLRKYGSKKFLDRACPRTLIGKTTFGRTFICSTVGSLYYVRKTLKERIPNIEWLANLDGGSSSFLTINGDLIVNNKRKIPSVLTFEYYQLDKF